MKNILYIALLFVSVAIYAQPHATSKPLYFIDSVATTTLPLFSPDKIEAITVQKGYDSANKTDGRIYVTSKKGAHYDFLTLPQIAERKELSATNCLYMIDDVFVKDLRDVKIDADYILRCEITNTKDIPYLQNVPALAILNIKTKTTANLQKENTLHIRGNEIVTTGHYWVPGQW